MTPSQPPELATWMLRHLVLGDQTEAIEGDLLEEFQRRRNATWYWRQVFGAILASFSNELRADWVMVWTVVFIAVWVYGLYVLFFLVAPFPKGNAGDLFAVQFAAWVVRHEPYAGLIGFALLILSLIVVPLTIYLVVVRNLSLRVFMRGLCAGSFVIIALPHGITLYDFLIAHGASRSWAFLYVHWYMVPYGALPLLTAIWTAQPSRNRSHPTEIPG
jgi:hypothetical protein